MVKVIATEDRLIIRQRIYIFMLIYYALFCFVGYLMVQEPQGLLGLILAGIGLLGWIFGKPIQTVFTYDRKKKQLSHRTNWFSPLSLFCDESFAPEKWVITVEYGFGEGHTDIKVLVEYGYRFLVSHRTGDAEILAAYVSHWEDAEIVYYHFGGWDQTSPRLYSKDKPGHIPSIDEMNRVYLF